MSLLPAHSSFPARVIPIALALLPVLLTTSCQSPSEQFAQRFDPPAVPTAPPEVDLPATVRNSARTLVAAMPHPLPEGHHVLATTFVSLDEFTSTSRLGRALAEMYVSQLSGHGIDFQEIRTRANGILIEPQLGETLLTRSAPHLAGETSAFAVLLGNYSVTPQEVFLNVRLLRLSDQLILTADSYSLPRLPNIESLLVP